MSDDPEYRYIPRLDKPRHPIDSMLFDDDDFRGSDADALAYNESRFAKELVRRDGTLSYDPDLADIRRVIEAAMPATRNYTDAQWAESDARVRAQLAKEQAETLERYRRDIRTDLINNGFPVHAADIALVADETAPVVQKLKEHDFKSTPIVVISAGTGFGKTVGAAWLALNKFHGAVFLRAATFAASSRYDHETRSRWFRAKGLVLDDLGAEYSDAKGSFRTDVDELIDTYYGNRRPLIVTTNCTVAEFRARYGERAADRIRESGAWLSFAGKSRRGKQTP